MITKSKTKTYIIKSIIILIMGIVAYVAATRVCETMRELIGWEDLIIYGVIILFSFLLIKNVFNGIRWSSYFSHTKRDYNKDHKAYKQYDYFTLSKFYGQNLKKYIDEKKFNPKSWHEATGIVYGRVGKYLIERPISRDGYNCMVQGLPGIGKTTATIIPTALQYVGSVFAIDIKGDILQYTRKKRKRIFVFDPENANGAHYNPFRGIPKLSPEERKLKIEMIEKSLIPYEEKGDKYWVDGARDYFSGIVLYMLHDNINTTFADVIKAIRTGNAIDWALKIKDGKCEDAQARTNQYIGQNEKNVIGCYGKLVNCINPFANGALQRLLSPGEKEICAAALLQGYDCYIKLPQDRLDIYAPLVALITNDIVKGLMRRADVADKKKNRGIIFILDEFPQIRPDFEIIKAGMSTLRSKNVSFMLAMQSLCQLDDVYGEIKARGLVELCRDMLVFDAMDPRSRKYLADFMGKHQILKKSASVNDGNQSASQSIQEAEEYIFDEDSFKILGDKKEIIISYGGRVGRIEQVHCWE